MYLTRQSERNKLAVVLRFLERKNIPLNRLVKNDDAFTSSFWHFAVIIKTWLDG